MTYTYTDRDGDRLTIDPCVENAETAYLHSALGVDVPAADLPKIVAELYKAAGLPNPMTDRPGQHIMQCVVDRRDLIIERSIRADAAVYFGQSAARGWHIRVEDLPELVGALYKAAGRSAPIILDRPENADYSDSAKIHPGVVVEHHDGLVHLLGRTFSPASARVFAALLAEMADAADAEMAPIKALADVIRAGDRTTRGMAELIARAVLDAGYIRSES